MDKNDLISKVEQLIEESGGKEINIKNPEFICSGFSNDIATFDLKYCMENRKVSRKVIYKDYSKCYKGNSGKTKYRKEISVFHKYAENEYVNVPEVYFSNEEEKVVLMEKIEGVTLEKIESSYHIEFGQGVRKFGNTLAHIHNLSFKEIDEDIFGVGTDQEQHFERYTESLRERTQRFHGEEYLPVLDSIVEKFKKVEFTNQCLNHGDYHFWNTIITEDEKLYVLDWEKASIKDYRCDLANTLILCYSWFGIDFKEEFLKGYSEVGGNIVKGLESFEALKSYDSFTACLPIINGGDDSHIRDRSFMWLKRRYELFVKHNGVRNLKAEEYIRSKIWRSERGYK